MKKPDYTKISNIELGKEIFKLKNKQAELGNRLFEMEKRLKELLNPLQPRKVKPYKTKKKNKKQK